MHRGPQIIKQVVEKTNPTKQGLKPMLAFGLFFLWQVEKTNPTKQGLKPCAAGFAARGLVSKRLIQQNKD